MIGHHVSSGMQYGGCSKCVCVYYIITFVRFQCSIFRSPIFLVVPLLYNCTFDAEEFDKSVVHKMSAVDFCGATAPEKEQHVSTTSATFSLEGRGGISRKMIKGPQYKQTASFPFRAHPYTHSKSFVTTYMSYK